MRAVLRSSTRLAVLPRSLTLALVVLAVLAVACSGKPGQDCTDTPGSCSSKASHLVCVNKKYVGVTCKGAGGCNDDGKTLVCDATKADVGDGCSPEGGRACSVDGKVELRCRDAKFAVEWSCRGGCALDADGNPKCTPTGEVGDPCRPDSIVCDGAQKTQLACTDGKLAAVRTCHGALGCQTAPGGGVRCDRTVAVDDEKCTEEGTGACDTDHKNVLACTGGHFKMALHCLGPLGCERPGNYSVRCDKSIVPMDEPCTDEATVSCSTEGKQIRCKDGKWVLDKTWKPKKGETCSNRYRISKETEKFEAR
jgi:hypothetical protein